MRKEERLGQIKQKLAKLASADQIRSVFASASHGYVSKPISPAELEQFERENNIEIPEELRLFWKEVGFGAGPEYGLWSPKAAKAEYNTYQECFDEPSRLDGACPLTHEKAERLIALKKADPKSFNYESLPNMNGLLPIQTGGCTYFNFIVLTGEQRGKVWGLDTNEFDCLPSGVTFQESFFDWYERWLDESLANLPPRITTVADQIKAMPPTVARKKDNWLKRLFS